MNRLGAKLSGFRQIWKFDDHWQLVVQRLIFPRERFHVYRVGSLMFLEDHSADATVLATLTTPMYTGYLQYFRVDHPSAVLDLVANNGGFPLLLLRSVAAPSVSVTTRTRGECQPSDVRTVTL